MKSDKSDGNGNNVNKRNNVRTGTKTNIERPSVKAKDIDVQMSGRRHSSSRLTDETKTPDNTAMRKRRPPADSYMANRKRIPEKSKEESKETPKEIVRNKVNIKTNNKEKKTESAINKSALLLLLFVLLFAVVIVVWIVSDGIQTETIVYGNIESSKMVKTVFIRDEEYISMSDDGICIMTNLNGEKVAASGEILTILDAPTMNIYNEIDRLNSQIYKLMQEEDRNKELLGVEINGINDIIRNKLQRIIVYREKNNFDMLYQIKAEINGKLQQKVSIFSERGIVGSYVNSLMEQRKLYEASLDASMNIITATKPCTVAYAVFSNEKVCDYNATDTLSAEYINKFSTKQLIPKYNTTIKKDEKVARAVYGFDYYIAFSVSPNTYTKMNTGSEVNIRYSELGIVVSGTISNIIEPNTGNNIGDNYVIVINTDRHLSDTIDYLTLNGELILDSVSGFKMRKTSVFEYDNITGNGKIYVLSKSGTAEKRNINILSQDNSFVIFEEVDNKYDDSILLYDKYIVNPKNIQEGQIVK